MIFSIIVCYVFRVPYSRYGIYLAYWQVQAPKGVSSVQWNTFLFIFFLSGWSKRDNETRPIGNQSILREPWVYNDFRIVAAVPSEIRQNGTETAHVKERIEILKRRVEITFRVYNNAVSYWMENDFIVRCTTWECQGRFSRQNRNNKLHYKLDETRSIRRTRFTIINSVGSVLITLIAQHTRTIRVSSLHLQYVNNSSIRRQTSTGERGWETYNVGDYKTMLLLFSCRTNDVVLYDDSVQ